MTNPNAIIVHGKPSREKFDNPDYPGPHRANWLPRVGEQLEERGYDVAIPEFPVPCAPVYDAWQPVLEKQKIGRKTTLISHSYGAGVSLRFMSEDRPKTVIDKLVLVAPWLDLEGKYGDLAAFWTDVDLARRCIGGIALIYSSRDSDGVLESVERIRSEVRGIQVHDIPEYGHFLLGNTMESTEFPELMTILDKMESVKQEGTDD